MTNLIRNKAFLFLMSIVFPLFFGFFSFCLSAKDLDFRSQTFELIKKHRLKKSSLGLVIASLDGASLFQHNVDKLFIPASLIKLFTASALLELLSPSLCFRTEFASITEPKAGVLDGDLYLIGGGDPSFVSESLWLLVNELYRTGIRSVKGHLIGDDSFFDNTDNGPSLVKITDKSYDAKTSALSFNWNVAGVYVRPGHSLKAPAFVHIDPSRLYFSKIQNKALTLGTKTKLQVNRGTSSSRSLLIKGNIPIGAKEVLFYRNILHPTLWTSYNALDFLKQRGIEVKDNKVKLGRRLENVKTLAIYKGKPLIQNIRLMMKHSNNFMVEMLVKHLGLFRLNGMLELSGGSKILEPTSIPFFKLKEKNKELILEGIKVIKDHLKTSVGLSDKNYRLVQASGLGRENRVSVAQLLSVLKYWSSQALQAEWESSFPIGGLEGTLKNKFMEGPLMGEIHAKTGSLNNVTGLAGYFRNKENKKFAFVFLYNGKRKNRAESFFQKLSNLSYESL